MEHQLESGRISRDELPFGISKKTMFAQPSSTEKFEERFRAKRPNMSYADVHHEVTKSINQSSHKSTWSHQKQCLDKKSTEEDELVKYMSKLPSYLERGKKPQDKALNVGVLDWGRLEKWQYCHKQISHRSSISSLSSSNTSSSFSTDESSTHSSRGHSCSPTHQRTRRLSLQFQLMSSPMEGHLQVVNSAGENTGKFQDREASQSNTSSKEEKIIGQTECKEVNEHESCKNTDIQSKNTSDHGTLLNGVNYKVEAYTKVKAKSQDGEQVSKLEKPHDINTGYVDQIVPEKRKTVVLLLPRDFPKANSAGESNLPDFMVKLNQREVEPCQRSFLEKTREANNVGLNSDVTHSCSLPQEVDGKFHTQMNSTGCVDAKNTEVLSRWPHFGPQSAKIKPTKSKKQEEKNLNAPYARSTAFEPLKESDAKGSKVISEKVRSTSPFRRISFSMGKMNKTSSSKDISPRPHVSTHTSVLPNSENPIASSLDVSCGDKSSAASRARSSPLRRLLDPLLKPKAISCRNFSEPLQKDSISAERAAKHSDGQLHSSRVQPAQANMTSCSTMKARDPSLGKKNGSPVVQALLRVQIRNSLPLFTFAVDNENDILAATVKVFDASRNDDYECIYTFFTIQEVKKKNGRWINQGGKDKGQDYSSKVIAQMKVYGSKFSHFPKKNATGHFSIREYVLVTVDLGQADQQASDFQPNDELAAIVIKIPKGITITRTLSTDGCQMDKHGGLPEAEFSDHLPEMRPDIIRSPKNSQDSVFVGGQDIGATVILPSGVHSLPNKGGPSSLIQRWRSGGSCDCGGWDLGCKLRILSSRSQLGNQSASLSGASFTDPFELFFQGAVQEGKPFFTLAPFKDGIYSVEFNSSLSLMQAFAICIATWDSRKEFEFSESINSSEEPKGLRAHSLPEGDVPAKYVSYPPHSPAGRV